MLGSPSLNRYRRLSYTNPTLSKSATLSFTHVYHIKLVTSLVVVLTHAGHHKQRSQSESRVWCLAPLFLQLRLHTQKIPKVLENKIHSHACQQKQRWLNKTPTYTSKVVFAKTKTIKTVSEALPKLSLDGVRGNFCKPLNLKTQNFRGSPSDPRFSLEGLHNPDT